MLRLHSGEKSVARSVRWLKGTEGVYFKMICIVFLLKGQMFVQFGLFKFQFNTSDVRTIDLFNGSMIEFHSTRPQSPMASPLVDSDDRSGWKQSSKVRCGCGWFSQTKTVGHLASLQLERVALNVDVEGMEITAYYQVYSLKCFVSRVKSAQKERRSTRGTNMDGSGIVTSQKNEELELWKEVSNQHQKVDTIICAIGSKLNSHYFHRG